MVLTPINRQKKLSHVYCFVRKVQSLWNKNQQQHRNQYEQHTYHLWISMYGHYSNVDTKQESCEN